MGKPVNPALAAFVSAIGETFVLAQVWIARRGCGFEIRHGDDAARSPGDLNEVHLGQVRELALFTAAGQFRPLKAAPNLRLGWRLAVQDAEELGAALNHLYPGAVADWHAAQSGTPPVTHYREFVNRQTGMYRITQKLSDAQASAMISACCHERFCLKRRFWTVEGLAPDAPDGKSLIPCLEPCALLLEFARKSMRLEQEEQFPVSFSPSDVATLLEALRGALASGNTGIPEADTNAPLNPRRVQRVIQQLEAKVRIYRLPGGTTDCGAGYSPPVEDPIPGLM